MVLVAGVLLAAGDRALAATLPIAGVEVLLKSISSKQVTASKTDSQGNFSASVKEESGAYDVFFGDENVSPVKITASKNVLSGRFVVLTDGSVTKDPIPAKKSPASKKSKSVKKK